MKKVALISGITGQDGMKSTAFCAVLPRLIRGVLSIFILMSGCAI